MLTQFPGGKDISIKGSCFTKEFYRILQDEETKTPCVQYVHNMIYTFRHIFPENAFILKGMKKGVLMSFDFKKENPLEWRTDNNHEDCLPNEKILDASEFMMQTLQAWLTEHNGKEVAQTQVTTGENVGELMRKEMPLGAYDALAEKCCFGGMRSDHLLQYGKFREGKNFKDFMMAFEQGGAEGAGRDSKGHIASIARRIREIFEITNPADIVLDN